MTVTMVKEKVWTHIQTTEINTRVFTQVGTKQKVEISKRRLKSKRP